MNTWLVVEREENWRKDARHGFKVLGFPDRLSKRVATVERGDLLIVYVASGQASVADVRRVLSTRPVRSLDLFWDDLFPVRIETEPVTTLRQDRWVRIHALVDKLSFTRDKRDWRQCFRSPLRRLEPKDANTFLEAIAKATKQGEPGISGPRSSEPRTREGNL